MEKQQTYSHGLLYSVAPYNFHFLHLHDNDGRDKFDWEAYKTQFERESFSQFVLNFMRKTAKNWRRIKLR